MNMKTEEILLRTSLQDCREKYDKLRGKYLELQAENARLKEELAAAQATIAEMRRWLDDNIYSIDRSGSFSCDGKAYCDSCGAEFGEPHRDNCILSIKCNIDALHEARALECERLRDEFTNAEAIDFLTAEAAAHRAKKGEGK